METTVARPASAPSVTTVRIYLRRSLDDEKQQASLETQRAICDRFIASHGFTVAEIVPYTDEKRSGDDFTRPGLVALLSDVRRGDVVVAYDDSRLGRDALMVALMIRQIARDRGARVFYAATGTEAKSADFTDDIVNVARGAGAEGELKKIRQRTRDGVRARVEAGYWSGLAPYGYRLVPDESTRTDRGCKVWLRVDEPRAPIVRRIYADYAAGAGYVQIAKRLNTDGVPGPGGRPWQPDRVHDILRASIYRGVVTFGATRTIRQGGRHVGNVAADPADIIRQSRPELAIVDAALADAVDAAHAARKATPRPRHVVHPLSGWARCGACGGSISTRGGRNSDGSMRTFYVCDRWRRIGDCSVRTSIRAEMVESAIATALVSDVLSDTDIAEARRTVRAALETEAARLRALSSSDTAAMESELTSLRAQKERAIKLALATDDDDVAERLRDIKTRIATVERQIAAARSAGWLDDVTARRAEADAVARLERARETVQDRTRLRDVLSDLFPEGLTFHPVADLHGEGWEITGSAAPYPRTSTGGTAPTALPAGRGRAEPPFRRLPLPPSPRAP